MNITFIFGSSGSGKTTTAFRNIIDASLENPRQNFFILVPEQSTLQAQRELVEMHPRHATGNIDVLSFSRLAYRVFDELNLEQETLLDDLGKTLILRRVAGKTRDTLQIWRGHYVKPGFLDQMKSLLSELLQYDVKEELIEKNRENPAFPPILRMKLGDMLALKRAFDAFIQNKFITPEQVLDRLASCITKSSLLKESVFLFDGFTGFTPIQLRIIEGLMALGAGLTFTFTLGQETDVHSLPVETELFALSKRMMGDLEAMAKTRGIRPVYVHQNQGMRIAPRFLKNPSLDFLEKNFLRHRKNTCPGAKGIYMVQGSSPQEEIAFLGNEIERLVKERGYRYREIGVICGNMADYGRGIGNRFHLLDIPYYMDETAGIENNQLVDFIQRALQLVADNFSYESINPFLRCGLCGFDLESVCLLDNYLLETGIRGYKKFSAEFTQPAAGISIEGLPALNAFKQGMLEKIQPLKEALEGSISISQVTAALRGLLDSVSAEEKLKKIAEEFSGNGEEFQRESREAPSGDMAKAREYEQVFEEVLGLFEKMEALLEGEKLRKKEVLELFVAGFSQIQVGVIPAKADRVTVGDLTRTRLPRIRALFVIGAAEGALPKTKDSGGIINDREKKSLKEAGFNLSETVTEDIYIQRFYLYQMFTKPEERLYISYGSLDFSSQPQRPSMVFGFLQELFPNLKMLLAKSRMEVFGNYEAVEYVSDALRKIRAGEMSREEPGFLQLFKEIDQRLFPKLLQMAFYVYKKEGIGREAAMGLFGKEISAGVTRLELFHACPYAHFLRYGLRLVERKVHSFVPADLGVLVHSLLEYVFAYAREHEILISKAAPEELEALTRQAAKLCLTGEKIFEESKRNRYQMERILQMTRFNLGILGKQLAAGDFLPRYFERSFGEKDRLQALTMDLRCGGKLKLRGKIDRVDVWDTEDQMFVKVVDYKTGSLKWEPDLPIYGREMQLILYMDAMLEQLGILYPQKKILPAAFLYYHIDYPLLTRESFRDAPDVLLRELRPTGLVNASGEVIRHLDRDIEKNSSVIPVMFTKEGAFGAYASVADTRRFKALGNYVRKKAKEAGEEILQGNISISPMMRGNMTQCDYCPYGAVCGFDPRLAGFAYRNLEKISKDDVWEIIENGKLDEGPAGSN